MLGRSALFATASLVWLLGCGAATEPGKLAERPRSGAVAKARKQVRKVPPLKAHRFAEVSDVIGPYVGRDGELSLAAWAEPANNGRTLMAAPIDAHGVPGKPNRIGTLSPELDLVLVRGFGAASANLAGKPRFALITTRRREQTSELLVTAVSHSGAALWGPTILAERRGRVLWVGFVVAAGNPLVLWAEQASGGKAGDPAALFSMPIAADGRPGAPQALAAKACAWQTASVGAQAALASVRVSGATCTTGAVALDLLGPSGKSEKSVDLGGRAALDLDLVGGPDAFVLAWSDHRQLEPRVVTAVVDARGGVRAAAAPAVPALGEQAVVALSAGGSPTVPAFLIWENLAERPEGVRFFEVSALDAQGRASGAHSRLLYGRTDGGAPELTPYAGGVAALTLAPACGVDDDCDTNLPVPTFVVLDAGLKVQTSEPLVLDALGGRAADFGWGLTCATGGCFALAAPSRTPALLLSVPLPLRENQYRAAAEEAERPGKPRVVQSDVLARADAPLAELALAELSGRDLVGYVTDFDPTTPWQKLTKPAEDGRMEPLRARIGLRAFGTDAARAPLAEEQVVSLRGHSLGGLNLASEGPTAKETLATWTGLDKGEPQVFLTSVNSDGKRLQQRMLTRKTGDASDVATMALDGGYLVAWVDERNRDAEVYAARVSRTLEKASPEQRVTSAEGAAAEVQLTRLAGKPYAVWTDARAAEEPGWADIYGTFLRPSDAARDGQEHRLSSTRPHSFAPQVRPLGAGVALAWLEESADAAPASVRLAVLGESGDITGNVQVVPLTAGAPRGLGLDCVNGVCHVAVTLEVEGRGELHGFEWKPGAPEPRVARLSALGGPQAAAVSPIVRGSLVYVADLRDGQGLLRRLGVEW